MVYTERTEKCISPKDNKNAQKSSSSSATKYGQHGGSTSSNSDGASSASWSKKASSDEKWKYNTMVRDNREKFNSLHFC